MFWHIIRGTKFLSLGPRFKLAETFEHLFLVQLIHRLGPQPGECYKDWPSFAQISLAAALFRTHQKVTTSHSKVSDLNIIYRPWQQHQKQQQQQNIMHQNSKIMTIKKCCLLKNCVWHILQCGPDNGSWNSEEVRGSADVDLEKNVKNVVGWEENTLRYLQVQTLQDQTSKHWFNQKNQITLFKDK